jgi:hypothetical protein
MFYCVLVGVAVMQLVAIVVLALREEHSNTYRFGFGAELCTFYLRGSCIVIHLLPCMVRLTERTVPPAVARRVMGTWALVAGSVSLLGFTSLMILPLESEHPFDSSSRRVVTVAPDSVAARSQIPVGASLVTVNGEPIADDISLVQSVRGAKIPLVLGLVQGDRSFSLDARAGSGDAGAVGLVYQSPSRRMTTREILRAGPRLCWRMASSFWYWQDPFSLVAPPPWTFAAVVVYTLLAFAVGHGASAVLGWALRAPAAAPLILGVYAALALNCHLTPVVAAVTGCPIQVTL